MKKFILPLLLLLATFVTAQKKLITPIVEAPPMNKSQAKAFKTFSDFNNWGIKKTGLDSIIKQGYTGKGIKVCICDTGKPQHFALRGRVASWKDFTTDNNPNDGNGHSTHVAGIVNEIAPESRLYFAKVLATDGWGTDRGIAEGIRWCKAQKVDIINMSLGGAEPSPEIKEAIMEAIQDTILVVAAVGNEGKLDGFDMVGYPAKYSEVLAVGSINYDFRRSGFSSVGKNGDLVAPGANILSLWLDNKYIPLSGTSMATPFVAGASALYIQKYGRMTLAEHKIKMTSTDMTPIGYDEETFFGRITPKVMFQPEPPKEEEAQEPQEPQEPDTTQTPDRDTLLDNPNDSNGNIDTTDTGEDIDTTKTPPEDLTPIDDGDTFADMTPEQIKWVLIAMGVLLAIGLIWRFFKLKSR